MDSVLDLWLPIVVSAVAVFVASFLVWMVLPHHKKDWKKVADEDGLLQLVKSGVEPGQYMFPHCGSPALMKDPEFKKRYDAGPHGTLNVWSGAPSMARNLVLTFIFYLVVGVFVAYLARLGMGPASSSGEVFRFTATAAIAIYAVGPVVNAIWFVKPGAVLVKEIADDVVYGLITGAIFTWLWPSVESTLPLVG